MDDGTLINQVFVSAEGTSLVTETSDDGIDDDGNTTDDPTVTEISKQASVTIEKTATVSDVNGEYMWNIPKRRNSEWDAGVGSSTIVSATKKYEKLIGKTCVYAVSYYKDTFHTKTKC